MGARRYVLRRDFVKHAESVGINVPFLDGLLEVAEMHEVVVPAARVRFPDPVVRRWNRERYQNEVVVEPQEQDGELLDRATSFRRLMSIAISGRSDPYGEHVLDEVAAEHTQFVQTEFRREHFVPWSTFPTKVFVRKGGDIGDKGEHVWSCYHTWQVFQLAAFLRAGASVAFDPALHPSLSELDADRSGGVHVTYRWSGKRDLRTIAEHERYFNAVSYFEDRCHAALQPIARAGRDTSGRLTFAAQREYRRREREVAARTVSRFSIDLDGLIAFVGTQAELRESAKDDSQVGVADAYTENVRSTLELIRLIDRRMTFADVRDRVGTFGGHVKPVLTEMFPDWIDEQRELVENSLRHWVLPELANMPSTLSFGESDLGAFCDWLEGSGFLQFYWHFRRLADIGRHDDRISRAANASEVTSLVSLIEHLCNKVLADRTPPETEWTLFPKVKAIVRAGKLADDLHRFRYLTSTKTKSVRQQLAIIGRIRRGGARANASRLLLRLVLLRNAVSHLGLARFSSLEIYEIIRSLLAAAMLLWRAR